MAYDHVQAARECRLVEGGSARYLMMDLASRMTKGKDSIKLSMACLIHDTKLSQPTLSKAIKELRDAGVIKTFRHGRKDNYTFYWQAEVVEQNRQSFNDTKPERKDESGPDEFPCSQWGGNRLC